MGQQTAYEEVTRNMVSNLQSGFNDFKAEIRKEFSSLRATNEQLYNHISKRLPPWGTVLITILASLLSAFVGLGIGGS